MYRYSSLNKKRSMLALSRSMAGCLQCRLSRACRWQGRSGDTCTLHVAPIGSVRVDPEEQRKRITALKDKQRIPSSRSHFLQSLFKVKISFLLVIKCKIFRMGALTHGCYDHIV